MQGSSVWQGSIIQRFLHATPGTQTGADAQPGPSAVTLRAVFCLLEHPNTSLPSSNCLEQAVKGNLCLECKFIDHLRNHQRPRVRGRRSHETAQI